MPNTEAARKKIHIPSPGHGRTRPRHRTQTRFHQIRRSPQSYIPYWDYLHAPVLLIFLLWREKNMTEQEKRLHRCCFTGHRPQKLRRSEMEIKADLERAIKQVMRVRFLPYNSRNGCNAPPQKSITARASCCSDRDCDFTPENKLNASVPPNDHPRDQKVPCLLIPILKGLRLPVKRGQKSADTLAPGEVIFSFSFQPGNFLIRFFVSLVQHCGTSIEAQQQRDAGRGLIFGGRGQRALPTCQMSRS